MIIKTGLGRTIFDTAAIVGLMGVILLGWLASNAAANPALEATAYHLHHWLREDGLPQNSVTAVVQTRDGYVWIGTYNGLSRFDGVHFTVFENTHTAGLASGRITSLFESRDGALWIGQEGGELSRYFEGKFESRTVKATWTHRKIIGIVADAAGDIWLQNEDGLLGRERDGLVLTPEPGVYQGISELVCTRQGKVMVGRNGRISILHQDQLVPLDLEGGNTTIIGLGAASDNGFWLVTKNRLREWKDGSWIHDRGLVPFGGAPLTRLSETANGTLLCASSDHGCALVRTNGTVNIFNRASGFFSDWITELCADREGGVWVGTGGAGLARIQESCVQNIAPPDAWQGRAVLSVSADRQGTLWVGTEGVGLYRFQNGSWTNFAFNDGLENPYIWSLAEDAAGNLWAGTWSGGLFVRHGEHFSHAPGLESLIIPMTALWPARQGGLWVGTAAGLLHYVPTNQVSWFGKQKGLVDADVRCVVESRDGHVWFGTTKGLFCLHQGVLSSFHQADGLPSDYIQCLHEDDRGAIWIGTFGGGLCRHLAGQFKTIGEQQGLSDNVVCNIQEDDYGYLWISSYNGIMRISKAGLDQCADGRQNSVHCLNYGISDGLPSLECSIGGCKSGDGRLWFATSRGLVAVNPLQVKSNPLPPPVFIESLLLDEKMIGGESPSPSPLKIPPGQHRLEFQYVGLSFDAPEKVRFKHRLAGLDENWIEAGTKRVADYNYIPPGNYVFQVIACNNDGVWNQAGASLTIIVLPHFWQTLWFRILALAGLAMLAGGGAWYLTRRRMQRKLESSQRQRAVERERTRIAKDIHDDLGASLTRINLMSQSARRHMNDVPRTLKNLDQICATARALTRSMDEIVWAVDPQHDTLDSLTSYLGKLIHELFGNSGIRCRLDFPVHLPAWPVTAEFRHNLFLAFKEALHNVLKHSGATEVQISLTLEPAAFAIMISDNGCGFDPVIQNEKPVSNRNGLGNMRHRLQEIGGSCDLQSQPGRGTQLKFFLPVKGR